MTLMSEPPAPIPRAPSPPFVKADPAVLGFPVFSKPIVPPKFNLSTFPKVSPVFAPINGGDVGPFPRKERVRCWKFAERTIGGIGGSPLKFKTWIKGESERGRRSFLIARWPVLRTEQARASG